MDELSIDVAAPPERVWDLVSDITRVREWSAEATGGRWRDGAGPALGARFVGTNRHGPVRWRTHCRVVACTRPREFAFRVTESRMLWGWRLEPIPGGTRLTQWREHVGSTPVLVRALLRTGLLGRDRERGLVDGMRTTLAAVKARLERPAA